jgi:glycosyltransferase involved in cell wall biosynthesis
MVLPMNKVSITLIVLTYNEEIHLARCLESAKSLVKNIVVVDSGSTDNTKSIAEKYNASFYVNPWPGNQAAQLNWALDNVSIKSDWILRLDADEYLPDELVTEIPSTIEKATDDITGVYLRRRVYFMNKWIRFGGYYPIKILRLWRTGFAYCELREMDEHMVLTRGEAVVCKNDFSENNLNDISWWISKHNDYASREAREFQKQTQGSREMLDEGFSKSQEKRKRWYKKNLYNRLPLFIRPFLYFFFRYFILLGFLDGRRGFIWHFLQGLWYRFLVDVKIFQNKNNSL